MPGLRGGRLLGEQVPCFIRLDNTETRGMKETEEGGAQSGRSLQTADTKPPPCTSERPTVQKCDQHNAEQIHFVCVLCISVCICIGLKACV